MGWGQTTTHDINTGPSYANAEFYDLDTDNTQSISHASWDIAFDINAGGAGVIVNEGAPLLGGARNKLYDIPNRCFQQCKCQYCY